jgi:hypothetical protein
MSLFNEIMLSLYIIKASELCNFLKFILSNKLYVFIFRHVVSPTYSTNFLIYLNNLNIYDST